MKVPVLIKRLATWLSIPALPGNELENYQTTLMNSLILSMFFMMGVTLAVASFVSSAKLPTLLIISYTLAVLILCKGRLNQGRIRGMKFVLTAILWINSTLLVLFAGGPANVSIIYYVVTVVFATLLFGRRGALILFTLTTAATLGMVVATTRGWMPTRIFLTPPVNSWLILAFGLLVIIVTLSLALDSRSRVLHALTESEEKYRALFESESDALILVDQASSKIVNANHAALKLYGYSREEVIGKPLADISAEPEGASVWFRGNHTHIPLLYHRRKDGSIFPAEINIGSCTLGGRTMHIEAIRDISLRLQAERRERNTSQGLAGIIAAADELIRCGGLNQFYKRAVELGREKLGLERCALFLYDAETQRMRGTYGIDFHGNAVSESAISWESDFSSEMEISVEKSWAVEEKELDTLEGDHYRPIGRGWVARTVLRLGQEPIGLFTNDTAISHKPIDPLQQELVAIYASLLGNMIKQKQSESALKRAAINLHASEERYRQSIEAAGAVPYIQDHTTQTFTFIGENIFQLTGYSAEEMTPALWETLVEEATPRGEANGLNEKEALALVRSGKLKNWQCDYHIGTRFGESRWVMDSAIGIFDEQGQAHGSIGIFQDITERKHAETEREKLIKELETKNAELERFTYTVSHDLKAPLITIQGFLGYLEKDAESGNLKRLRSDLARITEATIRMQQLLNDLLELSRIGRMVNPLKHIPFELIVKEALKLVEGRLNRSNVTVNISDELPLIYGDSARLVEVVQNLVDNAAKFIDKQPNPTVEIGWQRADQHGFHVFYVRDNGIGIPSKYHERIFGLFNKLDPKSEGTGVGLALVKRIIEVHNGRIWVESDGLGSGSTFYFTLPKDPLE